MRVNWAIPLLLSCVISGCALSPMDPEPARREPSVSVKKESASNGPVAPENVEPGTVVYVGTKTGSPDGALLDRPHAWGRVVEKLQQNQRLTVLDWTTSASFAQVRSENSKQEGWCRKRILSTAPVATKCVTPADFEEWGAGMAYAGSLYPHAVEGPLLRGDPRYEKALAEVDKLEQAVARALGGSRDRPDSGLIRRALDDFGRSGGLKR